MATLTQISGPLIGYASLAPRPHGNQAVPPDEFPPVSPFAPAPLAPAEVASLNYYDIKVDRLDLRFLHSEATVTDIRYHGSNV